MIKTSTGGWGGVTLAVAVTVAAFSVASGASAQEPEGAGQRCACDVMSLGPRLNLFSTRGPKLGVTVDGTLDRDAEARGARVTAVTPDSPAEDAGIEVGDIILSVDGRSLTEPLDVRTERFLRGEESLPAQRLSALARDFEEDAPVILEVERDGEIVELEVTPEVLDGWGTASQLRGRLGALPEQWSPRGGGRTLHFKKPGGHDGQEETLHFRFLDPEGEGQVLALGGGDWGDASGLLNAFPWSSRQDYGFQLSDLNPELGEYFGSERGALVLDTPEESELGLAPGDVVIDVDGREVRDKDHFIRILSSYTPGEQIAFGVLRHGDRVDVEGRLPS